jgi:Flp pilus assembly protein CpaB
MSGHKRECGMKWSRTVLTLVLAFNSTACVLLKTDERIDVVVAATDLGAGRKITDKDITITGMPVSRLTRDMPRKSSQVVGYTTKVPISKGEPILLSKVK